jgi:hypothetical protein
MADSLSVAEVQNMRRKVHLMMSIPESIVAIPRCGRYGSWALLRDLDLLLRDLEEALTDG